MIVLIDTSVWLLALRRRNHNGHATILAEFSQLVRDCHAEIIGPVRQEVLSGIKVDEQYQRLRASLRAYVDLQLEVEDYERAAEYYNLCRAKGIQGSHTDFLICAAAERYNASVFTVDRDFERLQPHLNIRLHETR